jgi:hypothetical protein
MVAFNPYGRVVPPFFIIPHVKAAEIAAASYEPAVGVYAAKAFMTEELMMQWLELFRGMAKKQSKLLLLVDNFAAHVTYRVAQWCRDHHIVLFTLPANSTGDVQPADVGFNGPLKAKYRDLKRAAGRKWNGVSKAVFTARVSGIIDAWSEAGKARTCQAAFVKAGIYPLSYDKMMARAPGGEQSQVGLFTQRCKCLGETRPPLNTATADSDAAAGRTSDQEDNAEMFDDPFLSVFDVDAVEEAEAHEHQRREHLITAGQVLTSDEMLEKLRERSERLAARRAMRTDGTAVAGPSGVQ